MPPKKRTNPLIISVYTNEDDKRMWSLAAQHRGLSLSTWLRQLAKEEVERQAALLIYQLRHERPHEINAIVEEILRQRAERDAAQERLDGHAATALDNRRRRRN